MDPSTPESKTKALFNQMLADLGNHIVTSVLAAGEREIRNGLEGVQFEEDESGLSGWVLRVGAESVTFTNRSWRQSRLVSMPTSDAIQLVGEFRAKRGAT